MLIEPEKLELFRELGYYDILEKISSVNAEGEEVFRSYRDFLRSIMSNPECYGDPLLHRIIPDALRNKELVQPLAEILTFSYIMPEYSERTPEQFLRFVQEEIVKLLSSDINLH